MNVSTLAKFGLYSLLLSALMGCQAPYLLTGAIEQVKILKSRQKIEKALKSVAISDKNKEKLSYSQEARAFATEVGLNCKSNFKTFVQLKRPYVSYLVVASDKNKLKAKTWWFPVVGSFPYKGFFSEKAALREQKRLEKKGFDTYMRGVTAYSSLGWFKEPILSSMLMRSKNSLAETIFHECFHGSVFIKNKVELNERLAVFFAHKFLLLFLQKKDLSNEIKTELDSWKEQLEFTKFLSDTITSAEDMYKAETPREVVFSSIQDKYKRNLKPRLVVNSYDSIFLKDLNNAKLVALKTYFHDFKGLENILNKKFNGDIKIFLEKLKTEKNKYELLGLKK